MDARSFVLGVACGACAVAAAGWLLSESDQGGLNANRGQESTPITTPERIPLSSTAPSDQSGPEALIHEAEEISTAESTKTGAVSPWPSSLREALTAEPKDDSWAYYMEQTLLQYLSSHPSIAQFDISNIECRTTVCQIEVFGFDESTVPIWGQVTYDIQQQPWSEFGQSGSSAGNVDDRFVIVSTFHRVFEEN